MGPSQVGHDPPSPLRHPMPPTNIRLSSLRFLLPAIAIVVRCVHVMCRGRASALGLSGSQVACHLILASARGGQFPAWLQRRIRVEHKRSGRNDMVWTLRLAGLACAGLLLSSVSALAGPKVVSGPGADPACFKPWSSETKFFQWPKKPGPYRIALVNGFVGNTWRIQMVKTAKAFADQPGIKENIKEFT